MVKILVWNLLAKSPARAVIILSKNATSLGFVFYAPKGLHAVDLCIVKPQLCHYHKGICREPQWGEQNCMQPHIVYLANSSGVKVGITKVKTSPTDG